MTSSAELTSLATLLVGLPKAGKTTYLAMAYSSIIDDDCSGVKLDAMDEDLAYLNDIVRALQEFRPASHTEVGETGGMNLTLRFDDARLARLEVPDLSGETWEAVHVDRQWDPTLVSRVSNCTGFIVFTNVVDHLAVETVTELRANAKALGDSSWDDKVMPDLSLSVPSASTQLVLVDLIQALEGIRRSSFNLSVVLSAYDAAEPRTISPSSWVEQNLPLLHQYLCMNEDRISTRTFGVSGQGCSYPPDADSLGLSLLERSYVLDKDGVDTGTLAPIMWALGFANDD